MSLYANFLQNLALGNINLQADDLRVLLLDATYTFTASHDARNDIPDASVTAESSGDLPSKALTIISDIPTLTSDPVTLFAVSGVSTITQAVLYKRTSNPAVSWLIAHYPTLAGLPYSPTGGNVVCNLGTPVLRIGDGLTGTAPPSTIGGIMDVTLYNTTGGLSQTVTRTSARMFIRALGPFAPLNLPVSPSAGDEVVVECSALLGGVCVVAGAPSRLINGVLTYALTTDEESVSLVFALGGWRVV